MPENGYDIESYSDGTFTEMVGWRNLQCGSGGINSWGIRTGYSYGEYWSCDFADYWCIECFEGSCGYSMCD